MKGTRSGCGAARPDPDGAGPAGRLAALAEEGRRSSRQVGARAGEERRASRQAGSASRIGADLAAARAVRGGGRPAGRQQGRGPQHVAAAAATCCSWSVTRMERELEMLWSRPGRAGLKMPTPELWNLWRAISAEIEVGGVKGAETACRQG